jgi:hypothetical protein
MKTSADLITLYWDLKACVHLSVLRCVWLHVGSETFVIFHRAASEQWAWH